MARVLLLLVLPLWSLGCAEDEPPPPAGVVTLIQYQPACQKNDLPSVDVEMVESGDGVVRFAALSRQPTAENPIANLFVVELHPERGFDWTPGLYDLAKVGNDINSCQICVLAFKNQNFAERSREALLVAQAGLIEIQDASGPGERFTALLDGVQLREVTAERSGEDLQLSPVTDGLTWCGNGYRIDTSVTPRPARLDEPVRDFEVQNCETGKLVSVHEHGADASATWLIGTTGWCSACKRYLFKGSMGKGIDASPFEWDDRHSNLRLMVILGEDNGDGQPTVDFCRQYAATYRDRWARERPDTPMPAVLDDAGLFFVDHDGRSKFSALFDAMSHYPNDDGTFSLPWNAVISGGEEPIYHYVDNSERSARLSTVLTALGALTP